MAAYASPVLPAYAPIWPEGYPDLQSRRDSQVYNLLQQEAARADKIREENRQIAAERADLQNNDKHKGRSKARSREYAKAAGNILGSRCLLAPVMPVVCGLL